MIAQITWNFYAKGYHLVTFTNGAEKQMTTSEMLNNFSLGHLTRRR